MADTPIDQKDQKTEEWVRIFGFGSLLSEKSARITMPSLRNFRKARLNGWRRVFAHAAPIFFERGIARLETKEYSSLSVEPCEGASILVSTFQIPSSELDAYYQREHEFRFVWVPPSSYEFVDDAKNVKNYEGDEKTQGLICARFSDEEYLRERCGGSKEKLFQNYGKHGITKIWDDDILPCRPYLRFCVLASQQFGEDVYNSFLDATFLGDRKTTIRAYLKVHNDIMLEEPSLERYRL